MRREVRITVSAAPGAHPEHDIRLHVGLATAAALTLPALARLLRRLWELLEALQREVAPGPAIAWYVTELAIVEIDEEVE